MRLWYKLYVETFKTDKRLSWSWSWYLGLQLFMQLVLITTNVNLNPARGEVYSMQHYVIKFVSDLQKVGGFP